jgi:hypothetical protein
VTRQRGPAERRFDACRNQARIEGDAVTLDALEDALPQARRQAVNLHGSSPWETVAVTMLRLFDAWRGAEN